MTRRSPRLLYAVVLALATGIACEDAGDKALTGCLTCGLVCVSAPVIATFEGEEARRKLQECGTCAKGQRCNLAFDDKAQCRPFPGEEGEVCMSHNHGPGYVPFECGPDLYCDYHHPETPRRCVRKSKSGEKCTDPQGCRDGLRCRQLGTKETRCHPKARKGDACGEDTDCAVDSNDASLHCEDHKCVPTQ